MSVFLLAISLYAFPIINMNIVYLMFIIGIAGIITFIWIKTKVKSPMLDLHMFRDTDFATGNLTNMLNGLARGATMFLLIFFLQGPYAMSPLQAGLSLIPFGLAFIIIGPLSGNWADRYGCRTSPSWAW